MKFAIKITNEASADLDGVFEYIFSKSPVQAEKFVDALLGKVRTLSSMPKRCPVAPESYGKALGIRHLIYERYRVLFMLCEKEVIILRIIHGARVNFEIGQA
ncbi:MAG: type II toxin-antitoxin system RelE/ParE family toxin [Bdellovibrionales bacterium]